MMFDSLVIVNVGHVSLSPCNSSPVYKLNARRNNAARAEVQSVTGGAVDAVKARCGVGGSTAGA